MSSGLTPSAFACLSLSALAINELAPASTPGTTPNNAGATSGAEPIKVCAIALPSSLAPSQIPSEKA